VDPGVVRAIEWEMVPRIGLPASDLETRPPEGELSAASELGILRSVGPSGQELTVVGVAAHVRTMLTSDVAGQLDMLDLHEELFRLLVNGWLHSTDIRKMPAPSFARAHQFGSECGKNL
jgi:hypothetical protein